MRLDLNSIRKTGMAGGLVAMMTAQLQDPGKGIRERSE